VPESLDKDETGEEFITEVITDIDTGKKKIVKKKKPKQGVDAETPFEQETKAEDQKKPEEEEFITEVVTDIETGKKKIVKKKNLKQGVDAETPIEQETKAEDQKKPE
ncbi:hypothetical protein QR98_0030100, partial [Sarcoptes scabiei]